MLSNAAFRPRKREKAKAFDPKRCEPFLKWLRKLPCMLADRGGCDGRIVPAHVDYAGDKGIGTKVSDRYAVPMCNGFQGHHQLQHSVGWATFEANFKVNALEASAAYWRHWLTTPEGREWEREHGS
jgi:hypothetical protein